MRPLSLILPASLLLLAPGAGAQTEIAQSYPMTGQDSISQVQVTAPIRPYIYWESEAEQIRGGYALSNGWRMKVETASDGIEAQIDRRRPIRLVAVSKDKYVSRDGNVSMEFNRGQDRDQMSMSYVPDTRTAQVITVTATLAQR
jgi:hypothetical protein